MIKVEITDEEVDAMLARLRESLGDMTEIFEVIGEQLEDSTEKRFLTGVSPEGIAWAPKAQATIDAYAARGLSVDSRPLFGPNLDTLPLRQSFFRDAGPDSLEVGTNKVQAAVMQFGASKGQFGTAANGSSVPWGDIPARPFLGISEADRGNILATIEEWIEESGGA